MPNLWGTSPVGRDGEGRSYATRAISRGWPSWRRRGRGRVLSSGLTTIVSAGRTGRSRELGWGERVGSSGSARGRGA